MEYTMIQESWKDVGVFTNQLAAEIYPLVYPMGVSMGGPLLCRIKDEESMLNHVKCLWFVVESQFEDVHSI